MSGPPTVDPERGGAPHGTCERGRLLLSLHHDGEATPQQAAELRAHLAACPACTGAGRVDASVRERLAARGVESVPAGFATRFAEALRRQRAAAAAQNRLLRFAAAAAVVVATVAGATSYLRRPSEAPGRRADVAAQASVREFTRWALVRPEGR